MNQKLPRKNCKFCGLICNRPEKIYCNRSCQAEYQTRQKIESGKYGHRLAKSYLLKKRGICCEICRFTKWNEEDIPLILDHIDGNHENNQFSNLRLVCGNCDMQLPTYKNRNKGNGRSSRKERYRKGLSY